jgi:hypothetical protein
VREKCEANASRTVYYTTSALSCKEITKQEFSFCSRERGRTKLQRETCINIEVELISTEGKFWFD